MMLPTKPDDFALFSERLPLFAEPLHVGRPNLPDRAVLMQRIEEVLDSKWLSNMGPRVQEFEAALAEITGAKHAIALCNGAGALEIAIRALGLTGEALVPSFTFVATAHAPAWLGLKPVFCDVDPLTHTLDPADVEARITPQTTAIMGVHLWGNTCNAEALEEIARRRGLALIFDAAHAFQCSRGDRMVGTLGDCEVLSFHATKFFNTFEGGAILTNNDELARCIRLMQNFGFAGYDNVVEVGTNGKMTEISAAMGLASLESVERFIACNRAHYAQYAEMLTGLPGVRMMEPGLEGRTNYQYVVLEIDEAGAGVSRDALLEILWAENVRARRYFHPGCHRMGPYRDQDHGAPLPVTERLSREVLCLPTGSGVTSDDIHGVCAILTLALSQSDRVRHLLETRARA